MSTVVIRSIWTADPNDLRTHKRSFFWDDPFAIAMQIGCTQDLIDERRKFDIEFQMVCPREDPNGLGWYDDSQGLPMRSTVDHLYKGNLFGYSDQIWRIAVNKYADIAPLGGSFPGVFAVRGSIQVPGSDLFDMTAPYGNVYQLRGK